MKVKQYKKSTKTTKRNSKSVKTLKKIKSKAKGNRVLVDKQMSFGEIINRYPQTAEILMANGMHCFGCSMAMYETLEQGAIMHGVNPDKLVEKINKMIGKKNK